MGPLAQGSLDAAVAMVERNLGSPPTQEQRSIVEWAVGAALDYLVSTRNPPRMELIPPMARPKRINEPVQAPTDLGGDPISIAKAKGFTGDMCGSCGGMNMVRTGTCATCQDCGGTSGGCS